MRPKDVVAKSTPSFGVQRRLVGRQLLCTYNNWLPGVKNPQLGTRFEDPLVGRQLLWLPLDRTMTLVAYKSHNGQRRYPAETLSRGSPRFPLLCQPK